MFNFRLINMPDGNQIIDRHLKTPFSALTPMQMLEYSEMDNRLAYMDMLEQKARQEEEHKRKLAKNPFWKLACFCGLV